MKNKLMTVNTVYAENLEDAVVNIEKFFDELDDTSRETIMAKRANVQKTELVVGYNNLGETKQYYIEVWYDNNKIVDNFEGAIEVYILSEDKEERRIALYAAIDDMNAALRGDYNLDDIEIVKLEETIKESILFGETKFKYRRQGEADRKARTWQLFYQPQEGGGILKLKAARQAYAEKAIILNDLSWGVAEAAGELYDYLEATA